jgi:hypothetical protein
LAGYDLSTTRVTAGGYISLTLVWEAMSATVPDYAIYTHIEDEGYLWGQLDGLPECGESSTAAWTPDKPVVDLFRIPVRADTPEGTYPLYVGLYDRRSLERLPVYKADGTLIGDGAHLADITVERPQ